MGFGRTEKYAIRYNAGTSSACFQHSYKQCQEKEFCLFGFADFQKICRYNIIIQASFEWWICQDQAVFFFIFVLVGKTVSIFDIRIADTVCHHVHCSDTQHRSVHIVAVEHMIHIVFFVFCIKQNFCFFLLSKVFTGLYQESGGTAGRVADQIIGFWIHHFYHHFYNMTRCTKLSVYTGSCQF